MRPFNGRSAVDVKASRQKAAEELSDVADGGDVLYLLSHSPIIDPIKLHETSVQAIFLRSYEESIDLMETHLPALELIEGMNKGEFKERQIMAQHQF